MMKHGGLTLVMLAAAVLALIVSCGDDNPVGPGTPKDYPVYFYDGANYGWFFEYHPASNTIDSFYLGIVPSHRPTVSADGRQLYVSLDNLLAIVDLESHQVVKELPYTGATAVSRDGRFLAIMGQNLYILSLPGYSVVYHDTIGSGNGTFSVDGARLYCARFDPLTDSSTVVAIDLRHGRAATRSVPSSPSQALTHVIPSADESIWFLWYASFCSSRFRVYEHGRNVVVHEVGVVPGNGEMILSPDDRIVFYTNPGQMINLECPLPPSEIYAYDAAQNATAVISTVGIAGSPYDLWLSVGYLAMTPDNRWLVSADYGMPYILRFNMETRKFDSLTILTGERYIFGLACQSGM